MILVDLSPLFYANAFQHMLHTKGVLEENLLRHQMLESIRLYVRKFSLEYGEVVICCDGADSWRKSIFPHYKASRKTTKDASEIDWVQLFEFFSRFINEIREVFPYRVIHIPHVEADDVIAVLSREYGKHMIVSSDKDMFQLQGPMREIKQFCPRKKEFLAVENPMQFLSEQVISGDVSDGIPNVLSDDDTFVNKEKRQKPLTAKRMAELIPFVFDPENADPQLKRCILRNKDLIDLARIPKDIEKLILEEYQSKVEVAEEKPKSFKERMRSSGSHSARILNYFREHELSSLAAKIDEFIPKQSGHRSVANFLE